MSKPWDEEYDSLAEANKEIQALHREIAVYQASIRRLERERDDYHNALNALKRGAQ